MYCTNSKHGFFEYELLTWHGRGFWVHLQVRGLSLYIPLNTIFNDRYAWNNSIYTIRSLLSQCRIIFFLLCIFSVGDLPKEEGFPPLQPIEHLDNGHPCAFERSGPVQDGMDCSSYYLCSNGIPYHMKCPEGTMWNQRLKICIFSADPSQLCEIVGQQSRHSRQFFGNEAYNNVGDKARSSTENTFSELKNSRSGQYMGGFAYNKNNKYENKKSVKKPEATTDKNEKEKLQ